MAIFFISLFILANLIRPFEWLWPELQQFQILDILVLCAIFFTVLDMIQRREKLPKESPWLWLMVGLFFSVVASHAYHTYFGGIIESVRDFARIAVVFILIVINTKTLTQIRWLVLLFITSALVVSFHCLLQKYTGRGFANLAPMVHYVGDWVRTRSYYFGIFSDPNDTALFLVSSLPLAWAYFWDGTKKISYLAIVCVTIIFLAIITTESRSGFMALVFLAGAYILLKFPINWLWTIVPIAFVALVSAPILMAQLGWTDESAMDRFNYWGEANFAFKSSPIFGVGYGLINDFTYQSASVHNSFITAYAELGVIGYTFWLGLIIFALFGMLRLNKMITETTEDLQIQALSTGLFASLIATCTSGFFLTRTYYLPLFIVLAITAALYSNMANKLGWTVLNQYCGWSIKNVWLASGISLGSIVYIYLFIVALN